MKKFKEKKTGLIWYAIDKEHIEYFKNNPKFVEVKAVEDKKVKKAKTNTQVSSTDDASEENN